MSSSNRKVEALLRRLQRDMASRLPMVTRNTVRGWSAYIELIINQLPPDAALPLGFTPHPCHDQYCYNDSIHACHKEGCNG